MKIGVIGYGKRINSIVELLLMSGECTLSSIADVDTERVKTRFPALADMNVRYYDDAEKMLDSEELDGILVGTRCSSHTEYALLAAKYNKPLYLEKPVCTTYEDLARLKGIMHMNERTVVSFPLRTAKIVEEVKKIVDSGRLGTLSQIQSANNVPYGAGYFHKWYKDEAETGGLFLQKSTHDLDYINYIIGNVRPVRVCAMNSKMIFFGDHPAGLRCRDCPDVDICPETDRVRAMKNDVEVYDNCSFAVDTGNEDSGSLIVQYENGLHTVYTQNFIARFGAQKRGARIIGYKATLEFDFYTGEIVIFNHESDKKEVITVEDDGSHFGGDKFLAENFIAVMKGSDVSHSTLSDGILSAEMCLAARKSAKERIFVDIE
ncbi:MAG: Gfo/Idh/MocA family oxidoreductase [Clostridia bacterium]|nr:Gfo/Idh/MocA family oxidoreductase [Clostridia bacterium]